MFDFEHVIEEGSVDDFKECVLAVVYFEPPFVMQIVSSPIAGNVRRLHARWVAEIEQEAEVFHSLAAERVITRTLSQVARRKRNQIKPGAIKARGRVQWNVNIPLPLYES